MAATWKKILCLFILLHLYLIIGMLAFHFLEMENEENTRKNTRKFKENVLSNFTCLDEESLERLITVITQAMKNGVDPANNATSPSNWEYNGAFFFSGTVITTIGYGHISPNTRGGKGFCIIYAIIGIPLCGFLLSEIGDKLYQWKDLLQQKVNRRVKKAGPQATFGFVLTVGIGLVFFVLIPALIFTAVEDWLYRDAVYYSFITLTTIGFGDYIAGHNPDIKYLDIYRIAVFYWIIVGLSYLALVIQDISKAMSTSVERVQEQKNNVANNDKLNSHTKEIGDGEVKMSSFRPT